MGGSGHTIIEALSIGMPSIVSTVDMALRSQLDMANTLMFLKQMTVEDLLDKINILHRKYSFSAEMAQKASSKMHIYMPITVRHKINTVLEIDPK